MRRTFILIACLGVVLLPRFSFGQRVPAAYIKENYTRASHKINMRDGKHLYTIVYSPKDQTQKYPILLTRTPYGIHPYEEGKYRNSLGPNRHFIKEGYIFAYQDVRGRYMSEGEFINMRPQLQNSHGPQDIDESTDTFDTIAYLLRRVSNHNGKVGLYGISYPGFYTSAGMVNAHPALRAASPQAPIADWFFDDFYHNGAFFLSHAFPFFGRFGDPRGPEPSPDRVKAPDYGTNDGYRFFLDIGSLHNVNPLYYKNKITFWDQMMAHPTYDRFWQDRNLLPHLKKVAPAVMTVGGLFDAEDLYGTFNTYQAIEKQNPGIFNVLVVGPWAHGAWARTDGSSLGHVNFGSNTAEFYQKEIELPFFNHYLKDKGEHKLPEAYVFQTGVNQWRQFDHWPPPGLEKKAFFLAAKERLSLEAPLDKEAFDSYVSDPSNPVPTTWRTTLGMPQEYMTDDMAFAAARKDVLIYQTGVLASDLTLAGPLEAELYVSTSGTDSDWVVKVIDVFPSNEKPLRGYHMHVRSEVFRGRYRNSFEKPEPFSPNEPTKITIKLQDVLHTFKKGHRLQVQIHSTWFPLIDRNPQKYVPNIFEAKDEDFIPATQHVYRTIMHSSRINVGILPAAKGKE